MALEMSNQASGGVSRLAVRSRQVAALILALRERDLWPPLVPSVVLVECLQGHTGRDRKSGQLAGLQPVLDRLGQKLVDRHAAATNDQCPLRPEGLGKRGEAGKRLRRATALHFNSHHRAA